MTGTILNAAGIVVGCGIGLYVRKSMSSDAQRAWKVALGALVMFAGLRLTWISVTGSLSSGIKLVLIALAAMILGRLIGRTLRLQKLSNRLGQYAKARIQKANVSASSRLNDGFVVCAILFTVTPLGLLGAVQDGLTGYWPTLGVKAVMDAFAAMAFVTMFGGSVVLSVIPVVAAQGTITLVSGLLSSHLPWAALEAINATGGLLVFSVALVVWEIKKVELMDYLPSLAVAPLLGWLFR